MKAVFLPVLALLATQVCLPTAGDAGQSFVEHFTNTTYKDTINTTADWDTAAGELRLQPFVPTLTGSYDTPGEARGVAVAGDLAFVADGGFGLQILDISDPTAPTPVGTYDTPGYAFGIALAGDLAFVADGGFGLQILDISDPSTPTPVGTHDTPGLAEGVVLAGDLAFVADGISGLLAIDITDPTAPTLTGTYDTPGSARGVALAGDLAFVADDTSGVHAIDITDPASPTLTGSYDTPGIARNIDVEGDLIYVADGGSGGLQVIDISDPYSLTLVSSYNTVGYAHRVVVLGDVAYVADGSGGGLQIFDVSDPANPTHRTSYDTPGSAWDVVVAGTLAFVADNTSGLQVLEVRTMTSPDRTLYQMAGSLTDVEISGNTAFVADYPNGLKSLDITDPVAPVLLGTYSMPVFKLALAGDLAFVISQGLLVVLDITDPAAPTQVSSYTPPDAPRVITVTGDLVLLGSFGALYIVDIADPANPTLIGTFSDPFVETIFEICVEGDLVYLTDEYVLHVIDIADPTAPTKVGQYPSFEAGNVDIFVEGDRAFVVDRWFGLSILDVSDPTTPSLISTYATLGLTAVTLSGDLVFLAEGPALHVLDVSDPASPTLISSLADSVSNPYISDSHISLVGEYLLWPRGYDLQVAKTLQSANNCSAEARSLNVSDDPRVIIRSRLAAVETPGFSWEVSADGGAQWQVVVPGPTWYFLSNPGTDLRWRATKGCLDPGLDPTVTSLTLDWLYAEPVIASVTDIPNDQGRQVRIEWNRSGHDFVGDPTPITDYAVYRQIDPGLGTYGPGSRSSLLQSESPGVRLHAQAMQSAGWDFLGTAPARAQDGYAMVVPTLADSTITEGLYTTTFMVSAMTATPGVFYDSYPDSGYSVDNTAPTPPQGLAADFSDGSVYLSWNPAPEPDFQYFRVYRSDDPGFVPEPAFLVHETASTNWQDSSPDPGSVVYKITALDYAGNEGDPGTFGAVTAARTSGLPSAYSLRAAVPNPFRTATRIVFDLPQDTNVRVDVFDVAGRLVRSLARRAMPAGTHEIQWKGTDEAGRRVATGIYLYRLRAGKFEATRRLVVIR